MYEFQNVIIMFRNPTYSYSNIQYLFSCYYLKNQNVLISNKTCKVVIWGINRRINHINNTISLVDQWSHLSIVVIMYNRLYVSFNYCYHSNLQCFSLYKRTVSSKIVTLLRAIKIWHFDRFFILCIFNQKLDQGQQKKMIKV